MATRGQYRVDISLKKAYSSSLLIPSWPGISRGGKYGEREIIFAEVCRFREAGWRDNLTMGDLAC
jgi:hypothetical protein